MAWTSSAGHEGTFALAGGAGEHGSLPKNAAAAHQPRSATRHPLALATIAHVSGLALVIPFVDTNVLIALPAAIGLAVSYLTLTRQSLAPGGRDDTAAPTNSAALETSIPAASNATLLQVTVSDQPPPAASLPDPLAQTAAAMAAPPLTPTEVDPELRAELMARVSHELRTPLNAVMGFSDLMGHQMFGPLGHPRYEEYVTHIRESSQRLLKSAEDTLAMTSLIAKSANRTEREVLPLASLFRETRAAVAIDLARRNVACIVDIDVDIEVIAHRRALRQALVNVMHEAIAQASNGARLSVRATADLERVAILVTLDDAIPPNPEAHQSLPICLARTLLELDGCQLFENAAVTKPWSVLVSLDGAIQQDFFAHTTAV
jgi:signal transduction histidine kinase